MRLTHTWLPQVGPTSQPHRPLIIGTVTEGHWLEHNSHELILTLGSFLRRRRWPQCGVRDCWATPRCRRWKYWSSGKIWECDGQGHCWDPAPLIGSPRLYTPPPGVHTRATESQLEHGGVYRHIFGEVIGTPSHLSRAEVIQAHTPCPTHLSQVDEAKFTCQALSLLVTFGHPHCPAADIDWGLG